MTCEAGSPADAPGDDDAGDGILVLGVGNLLAGDDGVGIHLVARLLEADAPPLPPGTQVLDGGTLGLELLAVLPRARALIVADALDVGGPPGIVRVLQGPEVGVAVAHSMSAHQIGVADLLALAQLTDILPDIVTMVGVQPEQTGWSTELSRTVQGALPAAVEAVRRAAWESWEAVTHRPVPQPSTQGAAPSAVVVSASSPATA